MMDECVTNKLDSITDFVRSKKFVINIRFRVDFFVHHFEKK